MRQAFTLIELMIVIAIIAIIAAIAVPNLLESRITANEASAAATLKSGIFSSQTTFQSSNWISEDQNDSIGAYASNLAALAGDFAAAGGVDLTDDGALGGADVPVQAVNLLAASFRQPDGQTVLSGYTYSMETDDTSDTDGDGNLDDKSAESYYVCVAVPDRYGDGGRRAFSINAQNTIAVSSGTFSTPANITLANVIADVTDGDMYNADGVDPVGAATADGTISSPTLNIANYVPKDG
jgi:prepilin-type N-terminal cleavage/methylation domain-containing protein